MNKNSLDTPVATGDNVTNCTDGTLGTHGTKSTRVGTEFLCGKETSVIQEIFTHPTLIFGCGNVLIGDDGFGPRVIDHLQRHYDLPEQVTALDVGTSIRDILFDLLLSPRKPRRIFIVDAVSQSGRAAGELFELPLQQIPHDKINDFSLHQFPSVNLLLELKEFGGVDVRVLAAQTRHIPETVQPGLSAEVQAAIPRACDWLLERLQRVA
jgi:coenzyme F420 hydrogenase subunit delta